MDFKLEKVLVSLHSLKTMGLSPLGASAPLFLRNGEVLGHSPIHNANYTKEIFQLEIKSKKFHQERSLNTFPIVH